MSYPRNTNFPTYTTTDISGPTTSPQSTESVMVLSRELGLVAGVLLVSIFIIIVMVLSALVYRKTRKHFATSNNLQTLETSNYWQITSENLCANEAYATNVAMEANEAYIASSVASNSISREDDAYWEPAATVNELYRQLSSKKYREIHREDIE